MSVLAVAPTVRRRLITEDVAIIGGIFCVPLLMVLISVTAAILNPAFAAVMSSMGVNGLDFG
jgi:hypothetical protein